MKKLKKISFALLFILIAIVIGVFAYTKYKKPSYDGEIALNGISKETTVYFDDYGVPHIYADSQKDALTVLG